MTTHIQFNDKKFRELVIYIAERSDDDPNFGATKLNKLLFFSDFGAYLKMGQPITGATYQRLPHGPAPRQYVPVARDMAQKGDIIETQVMRYSKTQKRIIPNREADLSVFSAEEIATVDNVIDSHREMTGKDVSNKSHAMPAWDLANNMETIPYQAALLNGNTVELTADHLEYFQKSIDRINDAKRAS